MTHASSNLSGSNLFKELNRMLPESPPEPRELPAGQPGSRHQTAERPPRTSITTLLVTNEPSVINNVQRLHDELEYARLEVCGRFEKAMSRLGREHRLLLVHAGADWNTKQVRAILSAADRAHIRAAVIRCATAGRERPSSSPYPVYDLPADLPALWELLAHAHAEAVQLRGTSNCDIDPITATLFGNDVDDQIARIRRVAEQDTTILLTGETGCGKSMLAKFIHRSSPRRGDPYLVVDCGALSGQLIESEMFGHARGAFTGADRDRQGKFAAAGVGTLVLDEINSLPLPLQAKLLRAVEERVFEPVGTNKTESLRARLIAISNVPLEDEVGRERFRKDLFYRLNVVEFRLPSLRERPAAVIPLAQQLLRSSAAAACHEITAIAPAALEAMFGYDWPGNIRELRNVIERAVMLAGGPVIQLTDLPESIRGRAVAPAASPVFSLTPTPPMPTPLQLSAPVGADDATRILTVLRKHNNNRCRAATELGMSRVSLYKKLHRYGLFVSKCKQRVQSVSAG
jgi:DNA-binding NtrC family response regulator